MPLPRRPALEVVPGRPMVEMRTAFALLTAYLSSFVDWYGRSREHD